MKTHKSKLLIAACVLFLSALACTINVGGPAYPTPPIPVSTDAVGELGQAIQTAVAAGAVSGDVTLSITEPELTSYLAFYLSKQSQPFILNPQAYLRNGQIVIYGTVHKGYFVATARIVVTAGVDDQGQLKILLTSADFGPLPVPKSLNDAISAAIQEAYTGALGPVATGFRLETVSIADGLMTITGKIK